MGLVVICDGCQKQKSPFLVLKLSTESGYCTISTYSSLLVTCDHHEEMSISSAPEMRCDILDISSADFRGANKWCAAAIGLATVPVYGYDRTVYGRLTGTDRPVYVPYA